MRCPQAPAPRDRLDVGHVPRSLARAASDLLLEVSRNPLLGSAGFPIGCGGRAQGAPGARPQLRARSRSSWPSTATALGLHPGTELRTVSSCWRSPRPELLDQGAPRRPLGPRSILDASSRPRTVTKRAATTSPERRSALLGLCDTFRLGVQAVRGSSARRFFSFEIPLRSARAPIATTSWRRGPSGEAGPSALVRGSCPDRGLPVRGAGAALDEI